MHPVRPELEGKAMNEVKDPTGKVLFVEFVKVVKALVPAARLPLAEAGVECTGSENLVRQGLLNPGAGSSVPASTR